LDLPYFYTPANTARVNLVMEFPATNIHFEKNKRGYRAKVNVLGIGYRPNGATGFRFSDAADVNLQDESQLAAFRKQPFHYEVQFEVAPGQYTLKLSFSSGRNDFGGAEAPLSIEPGEGKLTMSGVALSRKQRQIAEPGEEPLLGDRVPLVYRGLLIVPTSDHHFKPQESFGAYLEVYAPALASAQPPAMQFRFQIRERNSGQARMDSGLMNLAPMVRKGNPVVPVALRVPLKSLAPGAYRIEFFAADATGNKTPVRSAEFDIVP
jgi:hypothetical protein